MSASIAHGNFWLWFGGIWLAVGSPLLAIGLYLGQQYFTATQRLDAGGVSVEGMVLGKARRTTSTTTRSSGTTFEVTFRFATPTGTVIGRKQVTGDTWDRLVEREPVRVTYLPEAPQVHRIDGQSSGWWLPGIFALVGGVFTALGGVILMRARSGRGPGTDRP